MKRSPNYYEFLGVDRAAPPELIRTAYLSLMKQYHPDLKDEQRTNEREDIAALLNLCYDVLKDPSKRARYDSHLISRKSDNRADPSQKVLLTGQTRRPRRSRWDTSSFVAAGLALVIAGTVISLPWLPMLSSFAFESNDMAPTALQTAAPPVAKVGDLAPAREIHFAMTASADQAMATSRQCFVSALEHRSVRETERCVIFDNAYLEWSRIGSEDAPRSYYFSDQIAEIRDKEALEAVGLSDDSRLERLKQISLDRLIAEVKSTVDDGSQGQSAVQQSQGDGFDPILSR